MNTFCAITPGEISRLISRAVARVLYLAPGIDESVAESLVKFQKRGGRRIEVILDADPEVYRLGYGFFGGVEVLDKAGIPIRKANGIRIGVVVVDEDAWAYAPTPQLIEEVPGTNSPNAIRLTREQVEAIVQAIGISLTPDEIAEHPKASVITPEIGAEPMAAEDIQHAQQDLKEKPPVEFDFARRVRVYQSYLQFVDMKFEGGYIERHTITLPAELFNIAAEEDMRSRLRSQFRLIDTANVEIEVRGEGANARAKTITLKEIQEAEKRLRKKYLKPLGKNWGSVILKKNKDVFLEEAGWIKDLVVAFKREREAALDREIESARQKLIATFAPLIMENPPEALALEITSDKPDEKTAKSYLAAILKPVIPGVRNLMKSMELHVVFKDATYEMLNEPGFQDAIKKQFPHVHWHEMYEENTAVEQADNQKE